MAQIFLIRWIYNENTMFKGIFIIALAMLVLTSIQGRDLKTPVFYASFDTGAKPEIAQNANYKIVGKQTLTDGIKGKAAIVSQGDQIIYPTAGNLSVEQGTIMFWAKAVDWSNSAMHHYFFRTRGAEQWLLLNMANNRLYFTAPTISNPPSTIHSFVWENDVWHFVTCTWNKQDVTLYVDGKKVGTSKWPVPLTGVGSDFTLGGHLYGKTSGSIVIDEFRIYDAALIPESIHKIYVDEYSAIPAQSTKQVCLENSPIFYASFDTGVKPEIAQNVNYKITGKQALTDGIKGKAAIVSQGDQIIYPTAGNLSVEQGTIMFWAKAVDWSNSAMHHYFFRTRGAEQWLLLNMANNRLYFTAPTISNPPSTIHSFVWENDVWHFVTCTWNKQDVTLYVDGKKVGTSKWPVPLTGVGSDFTLGGHLYGKTSGSIVIDEFRIYDAALIPESIHKIYVDEYSAIPAQNTESRRLEGENNLKILPRNIVNLACGTILLPSSQLISSPQTTIEQAMDGKEETFYLSGTDGGPYWVEARWPQPVTIDGVKIQFKKPYQPVSFRISVPDSKGYREVIRLDGNDIESHKTFTPERTDRVRIFFDAITNSQIGIADLQLTGEALQLLMIESDWQSNFIWRQPENKSNNSIAYFRKDFTLNNLDEIQNSELQIAGNGRVEFFINNHPVGVVENDSSVFDVSKFLVAGKNVFAIKCEDDNHLKGVIFDLSFRLKDGKEILIVGDQEVRTAHNKEQGWQNIDFDDSKWLQAVFEANLNPYKEILKYSKSVNTLNQFTIKNIKCIPETVRLGEDITITAQVSCKTTPNAKYGFRLELGEEGLSSNSDLKVATVDVLPTEATTQWPAGSTSTVKWSFSLPNWAPHGSIPLKVRALTAFGRETRVDMQSSSVFIKRFSTQPQYRNTPVQAEVKNLNGQIRLVADGEVLPNPIFAINNGHKFSLRELGDVSDSGAKVLRYSPRITLYPEESGHSPEKHFQLLEQKIDQEIDYILRVFPDAYIIVGLGFRPWAKWNREYPDQRVQLSNGKQLLQSFSSEIWRQQNQFAASYIVKYLRKSPYAGHILGIHIAMGGGGETLHHGWSTNKSGTPREEIVAVGFSDPARKGFREFLRLQYNDDVAALRKGWNKGDINFETAVVELRELQREDMIFFRDPARSRMAMDFWAFLSDSMADSFIQIAKAVKDASGGKMIAGGWGFYAFSQPFMMGMNSHAGSHQITFSGIEKVVRSPYVDYIANIQSYAGVNAGTPLITCSPEDSLKLHGKIFLEEFDIRTFFTDLSYSHSHTYSQKETIEVMRRDFGETITRNNYSWFCGFARGKEGRQSLGWYSEESLISELAKYTKISSEAECFANQPTADIALFINPRDIGTLDIMDANTLLVNAHYNTVYRNLRKLPVQYECYLLSDLPEVMKKRKYKMAIVLDGYYLSSIQRQAIRQSLVNKAMTVLWMYAPGFSDPANGLSVETIHELTGIKVKALQEARDNLIVNYKGNKFYPYRYRSSKPLKIGPVFVVDDPKSQILANYEVGDLPAVAQRKIGSLMSVYCAIPIVGEDLLRDLCKAAGVHFYADQNLYIRGSSRFLTLHVPLGAVFSEKIKLPKASSVLDVYDNKIVCENKDSFSVKLLPGSSRLYFLGDASEVKALSEKLRY